MIFLERGGGGGGGGRIRGAVISHLERRHDWKTFQMRHFPEKSISSPRGRDRGAPSEESVNHVPGHASPGFLVVLRGVGMGGDSSKVAVERGTLARPTPAASGDDDDQNVAGKKDKTIDYPRAADSRRAIPRRREVGAPDGWECARSRHPTGNGPRGDEDDEEEGDGGVVGV
jgi:hypothetical protein